MGRRRKIGLDYFPFDVDFFTDLKVRKLIKRQGGKSVSVYALLLCYIYKNGYYIRWDKELPFIISEQLGYGEAYIREVIKSCLSLGLFNTALYESDNILTSKGVQERYSDICKSLNRSVEITEYNLISSEEIVINSEEIPITSEEIPISSDKILKNNAYKIKENKRKEKEKEIKEKDLELFPPRSLDDAKDIYTFDRIWELYQKKRGDKTKLRKKWEKLSLTDRRAIFDYVPKYVTATPDKQFRKDFATFLNNRSWEDEIIGSSQSDKDVGLIIHSNNENGSNSWEDRLRNNSE